MMLFAIPIISQLQAVMRHILYVLQLEPRSDVGVVDRGHHRAGADDPRPADGQADPLDAEPAEFAPQMKEIQKKYKQDKAKQNEELMKFYRENNINPAASCLPMLLQLPVFISLYYMLKHFSKNFPAGRSDLSFGCTSSRISPTHDDSHWWRLPPARRLRRQPDGVVALHGGDGRQDAADALHDHAALLRLHHRALPGRPPPLLGDDEPLDGRPGTITRRLVPKTPAPAPEDAARARRRRTTARAATAQRRTAPAPAGSAAPPQRAAAVRRKKKRHEPADERSRTSRSRRPARRSARRSGRRARARAARIPASTRLRCSSRWSRRRARAARRGLQPARVVAHLPAEAAAAPGCAADESEPGRRARGARGADRRRARRRCRHRGTRGRRRRSS